MAKKWYSISVLSNFENRVAEQIRTKVAQSKLADDFETVLVPTEQVTEIRRGKKVPRERRFMPGYVLIKMRMTNPGYQLINSVPRVTGFLGSRNDKTQEFVPIPMTDEEVATILQRAERGAEHPKFLISFEVGEVVNVRDGPFEGFSGMVEEVDEETARLKVSVSIFGRSTPVDLEYTQVSKQL